MNNEALNNSFISLPKSGLIIKKLILYIYMVYLSGSALTNLAIKSGQPSLESILIIRIYELAYLENKINLAMAI